MAYYEVMPADSRYRSDAALIYSYTGRLAKLAVVTIPLKDRQVTGFVIGEAKKPTFNTKTIKTLVSDSPLPAYCLELARWMQAYYHCNLGEALRQFAPSRPSLRAVETEQAVQLASQIEWRAPLTSDQDQAVEKIITSPSTTVLLHGETGTGKTRVYLELAKRTLDKGLSVLLLTPEISLTSQLAKAASQFLGAPVFVLHSQLGQAERKKIWRSILESTEPVVVIGPRSALFSPIPQLGLIVLDEAHEPAYKQESSPRYQAVQVASQIGVIADAKVVLGTATPSVANYYVADQKNAVVRMSQLAIKSESSLSLSLIDLKDRTLFSQSRYLSDSLIDAIKSTLSTKKQIIVYLNRRGSARVILCRICGWNHLCPNCDVPLTYHADEHLARCHICGYHKSPPVACPNCGSPDVIYRTIGTKALEQEIRKLFPQAKTARFDSDSQAGERLNELFGEVVAGKIDILVGTQLLAKGLDLPRLGLVGVVSADTSLALPDYTASERTFQLLYQIIGRVGRGHGRGEVIIQTYDPDSITLRAAVKRDYKSFYDTTLAERRQFKFPPFSYLLKARIRRTSPKNAETAASKLSNKLSSLHLPIEIIGPTPSFYARRGKFYTYQLVLKSKQRSLLLKVADAIPDDWQVDLDPTDLL